MIPAMGVFNFIGRKVNSATIEAVRETVAKTVAIEMQAHHDILTCSDPDTSTNNPYSSYKAQVDELSRKYAGTAEYGIQQVRNLIDVRSAFIIATGMQVSVRDEGEASGDGKKRRENFGEREIDYIREFIEYNNLDEELAQDLAKEAEIEGKILLRIIETNDESDTVKGKKLAVRAVPWTDTRYEVKTPVGDYASYESVEYTVGGSKKTLQPSEFVYKRFGGRVAKVDETPPKLGAVLREFDDIDRALRDLRKINHLFASPTPYFKADDGTKAKALHEKLDKIKWKIGRMLVGTADYNLVMADTSGIKALMDEIITKAKIISGATGVPVHFLGLPDLMSNRSTADSLLDLVEASTSRERSIWVGAYEELFQKVLAFANENYQTGFDIDSIEVDIPWISSEVYKRIEEVWLPLYVAKAITLETMLTKIPEIDAELEVAKILEEQKENDILAHNEAQDRMTALRDSLNSSERGVNDDAA